MPRTKDTGIHEKRQQQILEAARTVFAEHGFEAARMDDIAQQSGLAKGTLYLYYKNKDDLIVGLLTKLFSELLAHLQTLVEAEPMETVTERLTTYARTLTTTMQHDASILGIAYEFYAVAARQPETRRLLQNYFASYRAAFRALFEQGIERGEFAPFDTDQAAIILIALFEGLTLLWFTNPEALALESTLSTVLLQLLKQWRIAP
jgi:AcrR family transcriptional regulator